MIKIRKIKASDIKKIRQMIEYIYPDSVPGQFYQGRFPVSPIDFLHNFIPVNLKFLQECYVAADKGNLLGVIGLICDGRQKTRWKINRLILNTNAYETGKQLIDYVVNKYGGAGIETFITTIDENYVEAISLFKDACGFRSCTKIYIWENANLLKFYDKSDVFKLDNINPNSPFLLREIRNSDAQKLHELEEQCLFPQFRPSLAKNVNDFKFDIKNKIINSIKGHKVRKFVLDNPLKNSIEGYVLIVTPDDKNFWVDIILSLPYQTYYEDILANVVNYVVEQNKCAKLYLYVKKYYQGNDKLDEIVKKYNFSQSQGFQVLVKDYWRPISALNEKKSPIVIFPTNPACNIMKNPD